MKKCIICNRRKGDRFCPALEDNICSLCCGTKRQKEITCSPGCEYLKRGKDYQLAQQISKQISSSFQTESDDIFRNEEVVQFVMPLERSFLENFYDDKSVNDNDIYDALVKIYSYQTKNIDLLKANNKCEELIFEVFNELNKALPNISEDLKTKSILRILRSIKTSSGGILGSRNYLEMIYSQFTQAGKWGHLFK